MVSTSRPKFVLFGSSIVQFSFVFDGFGAILADLYARRADIMVRGYAGWNSTRALEVVEQVFPLDLEEQPSLAIVYFGGNDSKRMRPGRVGPHVPLPEYINNMGKIIDHLKLLPQTTRLLFLGAPAVSVQQIKETYGDDQGYSNQTCGEYSAALIELCNQRDVKVVDLWTAIQRRRDWEATCFTDGIHLSNVGSKIAIGEIMNVLRNADWDPSLFWRKIPVEFSEGSIFDPVGEDGLSSVNISETVFPWQKEWDF